MPLVEKEETVRIHAFPSRQLRLVVGGDISAAFQPEREGVCDIRGAANVSCVCRVRGLSNE